VNATRNEFTRSIDMTARTDLTDQKTPANSDARPVAPAVDVFEDSGGITLLADMPGVSRDTLDIQLDGDSLTVEGRVELDLPADMRAVWAEVQVPRFRRAFTLSRELDASRIEANLKDGVLSLRVPKLAHAQPRRIEVTTA
jgi:HSP20 family protein